ncbi:DUF7471 family protein [Haloarcula nitratireducens]|uniref:Uncharacterized protein n=1 Tax=Haloarcula nitratireducens TaxID=2487749 RepID=A0AAW4P6V9_9EURY|nr:hypothetical protein [Halomicroarcula nitratireducens]MBX0293513.1 hypothetical protein [Halomicroarcula nitratireducens]
MIRPGHVGVHWGDFHADFAVVLAVSAVATAALCILGLSVYRRRGSRAYLLLALALVALVARPLVAGLAMLGTISPATHHTLEHGADAVVVALVFGAVYYARSVEKRLDSEEDT